MTAKNTLALIAGMLVGGILHGSALADTLPIDQDASRPEMVASSVDENGSQGTPIGPFGDVAINSEALDTYRGGSESSVLNENYLSGVVSDNKAYDLTTGSNLVTEGSFSGANGLSTVIQNSGNNVLIQNSTIVNLQVQ